MENMNGFAIFEMKSLPKLCLTVLSQNLKEKKKLNIKAKAELRQAVEENKYASNSRTICCINIFWGMRANFLGVIHQFLIRTGFPLLDKSLAASSSGSALSYAATSSASNHTS